MSHTESAPADSPLAPLAAAADLIKQRAARTSTSPAPQITICLDEATAVLANATPETQQTIHDILLRGRANDVRLVTRRRIVSRQFGTAAKLNAAMERGEA
ncbi:hypothetical protein [Streptomyces colonosanans]|uniref:Uncharacterized protein n=1 Tax=Streptomyces colonosanans TaxID=1428652 RepID=A0A1S2PNN4_9ACTN|nr:hypothetical protein [Streptomyces colonosanans]OIJ95411.1 hypothetical protein BIV24_09010 [Streptomyces colonosanans]